MKKAVCVHEEDAGICWKHTEYRDGHAEVRRNRRLVLSFIATGAPPFRLPPPRGLLLRTIHRLIPLPAVRHGLQPWMLRP